MRICLVTGIFPPDIGGPASYVAALAERLFSLGHHVEVITYSFEAFPSQAFEPYRQRPVPPRRDPAGILPAAGARRPRHCRPEGSVTAFPSQGSSVWRVVYPFPIWRISRSIPLPVRIVIAFLAILRAGARSDLIYCNGLILPSALASLILRKPLVVKIEGDFAWERATNLRLTSDSITAFQSRPQNWKARALKGIRNWSVKRSRVVITTSRFLASLIRRWRFSGTVEVVVNAIEEDFGEEAISLTREECRRRIGFVRTVPLAGAGHKIVLSAGRLVKWKGFRRIISAAEHLPEEAVVVIIGEGPESRNLARLVESRGLTRKVRILGKVPRKELAFYLRAADCFVLNSEYESCPHVVLEAMKVGTPVVAARTTGLPEMITDRENGLLFEKDGIHKMVSCISECLYGCAGNRLVAEAARRLSRYGWNSVFAQTMNVLEKAAKRK